MKDYENIVMTRMEEIGSSNGRPGSVAKCLQIPNELIWLAPHIDKLQPHVIVEIGIYKGGWQYVMCPFFAPGAYIIGIDAMLRHKQDEGEGDLDVMCERLRAAGFMIDVIKGRSDGIDVRAAFRTRAHETIVDLLHIDGAHDYKSVWEDWEYYSPFVRHGGLVVLHDIGTWTSQMNVKRLWEEIKGGTYGEKQTYEFYEKNGIGVVMI